MVNLCLQVIQRLITSQVLDGKGAKYVVETMWMLMEANIEEVMMKRCERFVISLSFTGETATNSNLAGDH